MADFKNGKIDENEVLTQLRTAPFIDLGFAKIDAQRTVRQGFPEVIYCAGKTVDQVVEIARHLAETEGDLLATRADADVYQAVHEVLPDAVYHPLSRCITLERKKQPADPHHTILILTAGTSDMPVAEEAAVTAKIMGNEVKCIYDVGVAGIHRLFAQLDVIERANVIIVVAGMEGALASVVGGLVAKPVIAVPTSVGYGANFGGLAALLAVLNSCAAGVAVVNIDNGFGAGRLASIINHMR